MATPLKTRPVVTNVRPTGAVGPTKLVRKTETTETAPPFGGPGKTLQTDANEEPGKPKQVSFKAGPILLSQIDAIAAAHDGDKAAALRAAVRHYHTAVAAHSAKLQLGYPDGSAAEHLVKRDGALC